MCLKKKLSNGLDLVVVENKTVPLATILIAKMVGTPNHLIIMVYLIFMNTCFLKEWAIPNQEKFQEKISELGISYNGYTSR